MMTLIEIMARSVGARPQQNKNGDVEYLMDAEALERFASLVRAEEREVCHALRQTLPNPYENCQVSAHAYDMAIAAYGAAIRARGNT